MILLQTPEERFQDIVDFPFEPHYLKIDGIRIHYIDEGPKSNGCIVLLHGEPTWSYLYRKMVPILVQAGYRTIAPDLVGFGRSDKPSEQSDHTYRKHVGWMTKWVKKLNLKDITLFCQDWGSLIGLRVAIENNEWFNGIILSNGGLPTGEQKMSDAFMQWRSFSRESPRLDIKSIIQSGTTSEVSEEALKGYDAPFPDDSYKAGPRIMPSLVPISIDDPEHRLNKKAIEMYMKWKKPFLTAFSDSDPITKGGDKFWQKIIPGAQGQEHTIVKNASHFVQEDKGPELADIIIKFIRKNS